MTEEENRTCWFVGPLLNWWYGSGRSDYPWRRTKNLYHAIIAEILLLRTRRDVVVKVYDEFISRFPSPRDILEADERELERILRPLGLLKRKNYIMKLAKVLSTRKIKSYHDLKDLPGVGEYIASIVASIHLGYRIAAVDRNVARIVMRLFSIEVKNSNRPQDDQRIKEMIGKCMPDDHWKDYNLALLDLGWEVCKPRKPRCAVCPLRTKCEYARLQRVNNVR